MTWDPDSDEAQSEINQKKIVSDYSAHNKKKRSRFRLKSAYRGDELVSSSLQHFMTRTHNKTEFLWARRLMTSLRDTRPF